MQPSILLRGRTLAHLFFGLILCLLSVAAVAQSSGGTITGTVTDPTGGVLPGVQVSARNLATNIVRSSVTNDSGNYRIPRLQPGIYEIRAEMPAFKTFVDDGVRVTVGETLTVDIVLQVGEISEVVLVQGQAARIETDDSQISTLVDERQVVDLPLNGRNVVTLATLQPGVVPAMGAVAQTGGPNSSSFFTAGSRARGNNFTLDGAHNTNDGISGLPVISPSVDAVQEFRLIRNNFSAEYGTHSAAVVNVVTKTGSNEFHGTAFEFHRNDDLDAAEVFDPIDANGDKQIPFFLQNQFGGTLGGPIVKDRVFFFFSYEGFRNREGDTSVQQVETPQFRQFVSSNFPNSVAAQLLSNFPAKSPNRSVETVQDIVDDGGFLCFFCGDPLSVFPADLAVRGIVDASETVQTDSDQFSGRVDAKLSENTQVFGRFTIDDGDALTPFAARPAFGDLNDFRQIQAVGAVTHSFSPTFLNEFRFSYLFGRNDFLPLNPHVPDIAITGGGDAGISGNIGGFAGEPQLFTRDTFQWQDTVSFNYGDHFLRAGVDVRRLTEDSDFGNTSRPFVFFRGLFDFAMDAPYYFAGGIDPTTGALAGTPREFRSTEIGWFVQDDWKIHPRLTLNLGLRWDYFGPTTEKNDMLSNISFPDVANQFERIANASLARVNELYDEDLNNFAPRVGFAWDVFGDSSTSLRGGYGISYDKIFFNVGANSRFNPPFFGLAGLSNVFFGDDLSGLPLLGSDPNDPFGGFLGTPVAPALGFDERGGIIGQRVNLRVLDPDINDSYVHNVFLGIQRELPWDLVGEINYQGTFGRKLGFIGDPNRFNGDFLGAANPLGQFEGDTSLNRINPSFLSFNLRQNRISSNYNGINAQLKKRYSNGLAFQAAYTFGKSLDFNSDVFGSGGNFGGSDIFFTDPLNINLDYGRSNFDIRHRFVANFIYDIPFMRDHDTLLGKVLGGWQVNAIVPIQSGLPFTVLNGSSFPAGDFNADGKANDRPNAPAIGNDFSSDPSTPEFISGVFTTGDFPAPTPGTNGNLGKNTFEGPAFWTVDLSLFKDVRLPFTEESKLQFRAEFFNLLNRVNLLLPDPDLDSSFFGQSTSTFDAREIQFGLKFIF